MSALPSAAAIIVIDRVSDRDIAIGIGHRVGQGCRGGHRRGGATDGAVGGVKGKPRWDGLDDLVGKRSVAPRRLRQGPLRDRLPRGIGLSVDCRNRKGRRVRLR